MNRYDNFVTNKANRTDLRGHGGDRMPVIPCGFGEALAAMKAGARVARKDWEHNGDSLSIRHGFLVMTIVRDGESIDTCFHGGLEGSIDLLADDWYVVGPAQTFNPVVCDPADLPPVSSKTIVCEGLATSNVIMNSAADGDFIVRLHVDGRVEVNPKYTVDEAAKAFWDAVRKLTRQP